jgi:SNF family Na+-dependent transporter
MRYIRQICQMTPYALLAAIVWSAGMSAVFAKDAGPPASSGSEGGGAWVWSYMLIILVLSLAMIVVCKSSGRRDRAKPEAYAETKVQVKEK